MRALLRNAQNAEAPLSVVSQAISLTIQMARSHLVSIKRLVTIGPPAKPYWNGFLLVDQQWPETVYWLCIFDHIHPVILLPVHPASFAHNFVSGVQSFYLSESQDAILLQACHKKIVFWTHKFAVGLIDMGNGKSQDSKAKNCK